VTTPPPIPASPSEEDYLANVAAAEPLAPITERDPIALFTSWFEEALDREPNDANAMTLATVDADGMPDARMVLLKGIDAAGFTFFTNTESAKGQELAANPKAALVFHWKSLRRQVRVRGEVAPVSDAEADAYHATRARSAQIGAWASDQSRELPDRLAFERRIAEMGLKFGFGPVPRPPHWHGYRLAPRTIEFWRDRRFRLHERLLFDRAGEAWTVRRLYP
jgi:pyridoxamine 5'-phosphate oxidase